MATIKSFTDLSQSKVLAKILPIESADMFLALNGTLPVMSKYIDNGLVTADDTAIPCWSLAALLEVLPYPTLHQQGDGAWGLDAWVEQVKPYSVNNAICEVDACVEMIIKLKEEGLL